MKLYVVDDNPDNRSNVESVWNEMSKRGMRDYLECHPEIQDRLSPRQRNLLEEVAVIPRPELLLKDQVPSGSLENANDPGRVPLIGKIIEPLKRGEDAVLLLDYDITGVSGESNENTSYFKSILECFAPCRTRILLATTSYQVSYDILRSYPGLREFTRFLGSLSNSTKTGAAICEGLAIWLEQNRWGYEALLEDLWTGGRQHNAAARLHEFCARFPQAAAFSNKSRGHIREILHAMTEGDYLSLDALWLLTYVAFESIHVELAWQEIASFEEFDGFELASGPVFLGRSEKVSPERKLILDLFGEFCQLLFTDKSNQANTLRSVSLTASEFKMSFLFEAGDHLMRDYLQIAFRKALKDQLEHLRCNGMTGLSLDTEIPRIHQTSGLLCTLETALHLAEKSNLVDNYLGSDVRIRVVQAGAGRSRI
jgi:hypothetical protein